MLGWGALWQAGPSASHLMDAKLDAISDCSTWIPKNQLDKSMICAGGVPAVAQR